jgi:hypothetical protein
MSEVIVKSAAALWAETLSELKLQMTKSTFNQWLAASTAVRLWGNELTVAVANEMAQDWLMARQRDTIERTLSAMAGEAMTIKIVTKDHVEQEAIMRVPPVADATRHQPPPPPAPDDPALYGRSDAELRASIEARRNAGMNGSQSGHLNGSGKSHQLEDEDEIAITRSEEGDPDAAFMQIGHYAVRFWRPYLGRTAFDLWEVLTTYQYGMENWKEKAPHNSTLLRKIGIQNRQSLEEAIIDLEREGIFSFRREMKDDDPRTAKCYYDDFKPLDVRYGGGRLLSYEQHLRLTPPDQKEHIRYLKKYVKKGRFDMRAWRSGAPRSQWLIERE